MSILDSSNASLSMGCGIALSRRYYTFVTSWVRSAHLRLFEMCVLGPLVNPDLAFLMFCPITLKDFHLLSPRSRSLVTSH